MLPTCLQFSEVQFQLRSKSSHNANCFELDSVLSRHYARVYGLRVDSVLNTLTYFHSSEQLVQDVMHVMFEGVCPIEVKLILRHCIIKLKVITVEEFNIRLSIFAFGYCDMANIPTPVSREAIYKDNSLSQSGMLCFFGCILHPAIMIIYY